MNDMLERIYSEITLKLDGKIYSLDDLAKLARLGLWAKEHAIPVLEELKLGHLHSEDQKHIRPMGDGYGWCDFCSTRVSYGPCSAQEALDAMPGDEKC